MTRDYSLVLWHMAQVCHKQATNALKDNIAQQALGLYETAKLSCNGELAHQRDLATLLQAYLGGNE